MLPLWIIALAATPLLSGVAGHAGTQSGAEIQAELQLRSIVASHSKRALENCANSTAAQALHERAVARRRATAHSLRQNRGLENESILSRRDRAALQKWSALDHESSEDYTLTTPSSTLFSSNTTCALVPETDLGPYYVSGELLRTNLTDGQSGVPLHLDIQFIDTSTCSPPTTKTDFLIDIWHCNATGVYSGVTAAGQGGLLTTHGRGVQATDSDGVVQFDTIFPGHYTGRATHIHLMATSNPTRHSNNDTFSGGTARHIGQLYFDQDLRDQVEDIQPYKGNTQGVVSNLRDGLAAGQATGEYDPYLEWVMLGDRLEDGLLMWITVGVDMDADWSGRVKAAAKFEGNGEEGGEGEGGEETVTKTVGGGGDGAGLASTSIFASSSSAAAGRVGVMNMGWY